MTTQNIPDVQGYKDQRSIAINEVGIKSLRQPMVFVDQHGQHPTVVDYYMTVALDADRKGTHMSRFVKVINEELSRCTVDCLCELLPDMLNLLNAKNGVMRLEFPYFVEKTAPVSQLKSKLDYQVILEVSNLEGELCLTTKVVVPVTSLCPCSKEISAYSAHNQRSHVTITTFNRADVSIPQLINAAEKQASSELYGLLKREDEKFVTERAYDHPKFVEDMVRDVAQQLTNDGIKAYIVEAENFESIHNHSAYAKIIKR